MPERNDLPEITGVILDQWEASALADEAAGRVWSVNPVAVLAIVAGLRSLSAALAAKEAAEAENAKLRAKVQAVRRLAESDRLGLRTYSIGRDDIFEALAAAAPSEPQETPSA